MNRTQVTGKAKQRQLPEDFRNAIPETGIADSIVEVCRLENHQQRTFADALTRAIKGMSEQTAEVLADQCNTLRISGADSAYSLRQSLFVPVEHFGQLELAEADK
jgi:hypothetical protein